MYTHITCMCIYIYIYVCIHVCMHVLQGGYYRMPSAKPHVCCVSALLECGVCERLVRGRENSSEIDRKRNRNNRKLFMRKVSLKGNV